VRDYAILVGYENIGLRTGQRHLEYARGHKSPRDRYLRCFASKSIAHPTTRGIHPARNDFAGLLPVQERQVQSAQRVTANPAK
jgi:hypothetical protein